MKETIIDPARGKLITLTGFKRNDELQNLYQHWELTDVDDASTARLMFKNGYQDRIYQDLVIFNDSSVVYNFRNGLKIGRWALEEKNGAKNLFIQFNNGESLQLRVTKLSSRSVRMAWKENADSLYMTMRADGKVHISNESDPLHPSNIWWMVKPAKAESDSAIQQRVKACLKFYALYYRDVIKRDARTILLAGLPEILVWYNGGIGLPERKKLDRSWINCFYNTEQALKGYDILNSLIVKYEFDWPTKTKSWFYKTHAVLEQMYHKCNNASR